MGRPDPAAAVADFVVGKAMDVAGVFSRLPEGNGILITRTDYEGRRVGGICSRPTGTAGVGST